MATKKDTLSPEEPLLPEVYDLAPDCSHITEYDRQHFFTYARLVTAHDEKWRWRRGATEILHLETENEKAAERCYHSHVERALWIAGRGLSGY